MMVKRLIGLLLTVLFFVACAAKKPLVVPMVYEVPVISEAKKLEAQTAEKAARKLCLQSEYNRCASFFLDAAGIFRTFGLKKLERRSLIGAAKAYAKAGSRDEGIRTMARVEGLYNKYETPEDDVQFLINLYRKMEKKQLKYPVPGEQRVIFFE